MRAIIVDRANVNFHAVRARQQRRTWAHVGAVQKEDMFASDDGSLRAEPRR